MSEEEQFKSTLQEAREVFLFLTEGEPSPDDEIEARPKLITYFKTLKDLDTHPEYTMLIGSILDKLENWDTLELWFSETTIPEDINKILKIPESKEKTESPEASTSTQAEPEQVVERTEIDITQIVDKVSEQFKGEIEGLRGTIDDLKKELEKKDETLKSITHQKKIQKFTLKKEGKLPPPKIKIPVIKKPVAKSKVSNYAIRREPIIKEESNAKPVQIETPKFNSKSVEELSPIPFKPEKTSLQIEEQDLTPIPVKKPEIIPYIIEEPKEIPIITEKRKITPVITEETKPTSDVETGSDEQKVAPFSMQKPKITSVKIEEIETESIKSSANDLFNVFSSVGEKSTKKPQQKTEPKEEAFEIGKKIKEEKKKHKKEQSLEVQPSPFVGFSKPKSPYGDDFDTSDFDELPSDKDSLYQELIALEGRRYSFEKGFKELETNYSKGSIADSEFKNQAEVLKKKLSDITARINNIRRMISSM